MHAAGPLQPRAARGLQPRRRRPAPTKAGVTELVLQPAQNPPSLFRANFREVWAFMRKQPLSFWLICTYLFMEYVRPQNLAYSPIYGMPVPFWTIIICTISYFLEGNRLRQWTLADSCLALFSAVVVLSSFTAYSPQAAFDEWSLFFSWVLIYFLITGIVNTEQRLFVFMLLYLIFCMKMTQHGVRSWAFSGFRFIRVGVSCAPAWFRNSGECGIQLSMLLPISLFFLISLRPLWKKWKYAAFMFILPVAAGIATVATSSRGTLLAVAGVALWFVLKSPKRFQTLLAVGLTATLVWSMVPERQKARLSEMGQDHESQTRLTYWEHGLEIMREYPVLGIGYKNWLPYYRQHYAMWGQVPHNIFIEAGAELGYTGLIAFVVLILASFEMNRRTRRLSYKAPDTGPFFRALSHGFDAALVAYLIGGFFVTVLYYPFFWINLAMTVALYSVTSNRAAGVAASAGATRRRHRAGTQPDLPAVNHGA